MAELIITHSDKHAVTRNYFDNGRKYYYRIIGDGSLEHKIGDGDWNPISPLPPDEKIKKVAADNNRVLILTEDGNLYWKCLKEDSASWVIFIFTVAELIGKADANSLIWDNIPEDLKKIEGQSYPSLSDWSAAYREWVLTAHNPQKWNLLDREINAEKIADMAVGNWNNTVVTYYVLTKSKKIMFLDEEPLMQTWEVVPGYDEISLDDTTMICASHSVIAATSGNKIHWIRFDAHTNDHIPLWPLNWNEAWVGIPKELSFDPPFEIPGDMEPPYDLPENMAPIDLPDNIGPPWDFLDRTNYPGWHTVEAPVKAIDEFLIDVGFPAEPWPVPKPDVNIVSAVTVWRLHLLVALISEQIDRERGVHSEVGFLGENPMKPNCDYPVCCIIKHGDQYKGFMIQKSTAKYPSVEWENINPVIDIVNDGSSIIGWIRTKFTEGMAKACDWGENLERQCGEHRYKKCIEEEDRGYEECAEREDQGYQRCSEWSFQCPSWVPDWACNAANEFARLVCTVWTWVSNWVCIAWTWVSKMVCIAWTWIVIRLCRTVSRVVKKTTCWARPCWKK